MNQITDDTGKKMEKTFFLNNRIKRKDKGTTILEMVVSFTLLAIFLSASVVIISNVTMLYYRVRGENYARQVGDIVVNKIASEISGAQYNEKDSSSDPYIISGSDYKTEIGYPKTIDGDAIVLYDRTNTKVGIFASDGILKIYYYPITDETDSTGANDRKELYWNFDKNIYNGYEIESLEFAPADSAKNVGLASLYGISDTDISDYNSNVIAVYMQINSNKYGSFSICRYVKLYNYPENCVIVQK
ncbi:MAG: hypothetical protein K6G75_13285 [Lachnospiraceae bacterium]|nr:hypothetical protein [Lachnospiraceae bacterium]